MPRNSAIRYWLVMLASLGLILGAIYISLTNGQFDMSVTDVAKTLLRIHPSPDYDLVIFDFRLPRIVIAALVGFALGIAGAVIQGVTRNGLADPGILGINAGAGAAIVLFMFFFQGGFNALGWLSTLSMPLFGLIGGLGAAALIYFFSWRNGKLDSQRLILVGIAVGSGLGALTLFLSLRMNPHDFEMAAVWLTGSIWNANWAYIVSMLPWLIVLIPMIMRKAYIIDLLQLGEDGAKSLGVSTEKDKNTLLLGSIGIVSVCVSVSGNIGFIGLMAPHIARRLVGIHYQRVLPVSGMMGMALVIVSDCIARMVFAPAELAVGIVISIIGVPYFVYLLYKAKA